MPCEHQGALPTTEAAEWKRSHQNPGGGEQGRKGKSEISRGWCGALTGVEDSAWERLHGAECTDSGKGEARGPAAGRCSPLVPMVDHCSVSPPHVDVRMAGGR